MTHLEHEIKNSTVYLLIFGMNIQFLDKVNAFRYCRVIIRNITYFIRYLILVYIIVKIVILPARNLIRPVSYYCTQNLFLNLELSQTLSSF